jgi:uncharacterized phage protein (TIGR02220 family)
MKKAIDNGREDKNPWTKWYWQDWESDIGLQLSSLTAQGLWMQMLSCMAKSKNKGYLLDGEKQMETKTLAKKARSTPEEIEPLIAELRSHNVFSETPDGVIYNRRMVREAKLSKTRSKVGRLGGRPKKQNESNGKPKAKPKTKEHVKAPSASAYASAYASNNKNKDIIEEIINYLNEKTGKKFSARGEAVRLISGRLSEGRTLEDFKYVIDVKVAKWKGKTWIDKTTLKEVQGDDYLRPSTLFRLGRFDEYLNELMPVKKIEPGQRNLEREKRDRELIDKWRAEYETLKKKYMKEKGLKNEEDIDPFDFPTLTEFARKKEEGQ